MNAVNGETDFSRISRHQPVMVDSVIDLLQQSHPTGTTLEGTVVDGTVGGGGHAEAILKRLSPAGRLTCFDRDPTALELAQHRLKNDPRVTFIHDSYSDIEKHLAPDTASAVLLDLGLSSNQLDAERGFSYSSDSRLDMRFDPSSDISAYDVVNKYSITKLRQVFFKYGEEPLAPRIARRIAETRGKGAIRSSLELAEVIAEAVPYRFRIKSVSRIFQAIRIEVNNEIELLERGLEACWKTLQLNGVFCVISYHSIEDRRMKRFLSEKVKGCTCPPKLPICVCGKKPSARVLTRSALRPAPKEIRFNPRSRSARLRAALKIETV